MQRHGWATALSTAAAQVKHSALRPTSHQPIEVTSLAGNSLLQQQQQALMLEEGAPWGSILQRLQPSLVKHLVCPVDFTKTAQMQALKIIINPCKPYLTASAPRRLCADLQR
jgi:hypothetical protein